MGEQSLPYQRLFVLVAVLGLGGYFAYSSGREHGYRRGYLDGFSAGSLNQTQEAEECKKAISEASSLKTRNSETGLEIERLTALYGLKPGQKACEVFGEVCEDYVLAQIDDAVSALNCRQPQEEDESDPY